MASTETPICPFENIPPEEAQQIAETTDITVKLLDQRYTEKHKKILRGVHPKSHGCVDASFEINADLDSDLQVGLFSQPGNKYDAIVRFSNASTLVRPDIDEDGSHGSRGMAIKVLAVEGELLLDDNGVSNQDFLMINQPVFAFANTPDYLRLSRIIQKNDDEPSAFFAPIQLNLPETTEQQKQQIEAYIKRENLTPADIQRILDTFTIVQQIKASGVANPLNVQYFSAAPFLFGADKVMKFSVKPRLEVEPLVIPDNPSADYLQEAVSQSLQNEQSLVFDFMVQVRSDSGNMELENASSLWEERAHPFVNVATLTISAPQLEISTVENRKHCENLSFTPWHSLAAHQPIGSINRLRKPVYQASAEQRLYNPEDDLPAFVKWLKKLIKCITG